MTSRVGRSVGGERQALAQCIRRGVSTLLEELCRKAEKDVSHIDGMVITGAPVENMAFEDVDYWDELCRIMEWSKTNVHSTLHICWGAQAGLYYHYGIQKHTLPEKLFGVYPHHADYKRAILLRGFDDTFWVPHSRHTTVYREDIEAVPQLKILASSQEAGVYAVMTKRDGRFLSPDTLNTTRILWQRSTTGTRIRDFPSMFRKIISPMMTIPGSPLSAGVDMPIYCSATGSITLCTRQHPMTLPISARIGKAPAPRFKDDEKMFFRASEMRSCFLEK